VPTAARTNRTLIDSAEVARRLGVNARFVRRLVGERRIRYVKVGHLVRFDPAEVERFVEQSSVGARNPHLPPPASVSSRASR
jgi:excisionase family DNA binding protein